MVYLPIEREGTMSTDYLHMSTGNTDTETAENIYTFLRDNRTIITRCDLVFQLDGTATSICIKELSRGTYSAFPAVTKDSHISWGNYIGKGEHIPADAIMLGTEAAHTVAVDMLTNVVARTIAHRDANTTLDDQTVMDMRAETHIEARP